MKAAVVHNFASPLAVEDVPKPQAGPGEVVVRIETSGLCHTDIHAAHGDWPVKPNPPFIPGHEGVGIVESLGEGVTEVVVGDRVALPWLGYACGACEYCTTGWETLCEQQRNTGYSIDGGYAEYALGSAKYVAGVPDGVDPLDAAPLTCAGVTTYKAVKLSGARPASLVAVFGIGGLGHLALQYAEGVRAGLRVAAARRHPRLRRAARRQHRPAADLRDGAQRHHGRRLDRRHPHGPGRGVPAARPRPDPGDPREPQPRRGKRVLRGGGGRQGQGAARLRPAVRVPTTPAHRRRGRPPM